MTERYVKKQIPVEAMQLTQDNLVQAWGWVRDRGGDPAIKAVGWGFEIYTPRGEVLRACVGDWLIQGVEGEVYICPETVFDKSYELVK